MSKTDEADQARRDYRAWLVSAEQKAQEDFDKTVLSLSGGALGVSFVFLKDIIGAKPVVRSGLLFASWTSWALSTVAVLLSYHLSHLALRRAILDCDANKLDSERPGGGWATLTSWLNIAGLVLFLVGVLLMTFFAHSNLRTPQ